MEFSGMKIKAFITCILIILGSSCQSANAAECSEKEAYAAEIVTDYLDSWQNVYSFFEQFRHCYDASIAEGAEYKIQQLWAEHWHDLPEMIALIKKDPKFKAFIWERISDETFSQEAFGRFVQHAAKECPVGAEEYCQAVIAKSAKHRQPN
jgi:hypothetical protein